MRNIRDFNQDWRFWPGQIARDARDHGFQPVTLPHTNKLFSGTFVNNDDFQFTSTYYKQFTLGDDAVGKSIFLDFAGAMLVAAVYVNGELMGVHRGGFTPFSFDITDVVTAGENDVLVYVNAAEDPAVPPYGGQVDFLTFGGLYRDVSLRIVDPCHIIDAVVRTADVLTAPRLTCDIHLSLLQADLTLELALEDADRRPVARQTKEVDAQSLLVLFSDLDNIALWSLANPALYTLRLVLYRHGSVVDEHVVRFGFRSADFRDDGSFYLNGQPLKLFGLNRHQTYPYIGAAAPARLQQLDADTLKYELGCNIVRTSHYAQSPHFLNRCDEIGLLVFEELVGWHFIGDDAWKSLALQDLQAMIERDRNHPSIVLWGVRINESPDDEAFYTQTNALAHQLDPTRQTGGVRDFIDSQFLEDVFTLNDFTEGVQQPRHRPHLITEFAGHMYPTKTWDHEERRIEHALKHARKHSLQMGNPDVAGAIGWCAFDYHTHKDFGSGDRVCYHGVMDIYRLPKMAAYFYRSLKSPADDIVLYAATSWTMGDRSGGGNNPLTVFSNCEEIEVIIGATTRGRFKPDDAQYPHLPHPPFTIRWPEPYNPWGDKFEDLTIRGYIAGHPVAEHKIDAEHVPHHLHVRASTTQLRSDDADMARVAVQVVDKYDNVLPYQMRVVHLRLQGPGDLIGDNPLVLRGGQAAVFVRSRLTAGEIVVHACSEGLPDASIAIAVE